MRTDNVGGKIDVLFSIDSSRFLKYLDRSNFSEASLRLQPEDGIVVSFPNIVVIIFSDVEISAAKRGSKRCPEVLLTAPDNNGAGRYFDLKIYILYVGF